MPLGTQSADLWWAAAPTDPPGPLPTVSSRGNPSRSPVARLGTWAESPYLPGVPRQRLFELNRRDFPLISRLLITFRLIFFFFLIELLHNRLSNSLITGCKSQFALGRLQMLIADNDPQLTSFSTPPRL